MLIGDIVRRNAYRFPRQIALAGEEQRYNFKQFDQRTNALGRALLSLGNTKGDAIGFLSQNSPRCWEIYCGVAKAGLVNVPLNNRFVGRELVRLINRCDITTLLVGKEYRNTIGAIRPQIPKVKNYISLDIDKNEDFLLNFEDLIDGYSSRELIADIQEDDLVCLIHTSGTTGPPKEAMWTHRNWIVGSQDIVLTHHLEGKDVLLQTIPYYHIAFAWLNLSCHYRGGRIVIVKQPEIETILSTIQKEKITLLLLVPTLIIRLLDHPERGAFDLTSIKTIFYGASPMPAAVLKRALKDLGNIFVQLYGFTEQAGAVTYLNKEDHNLDQPENEKRITSCGREMPGNDVRIVNDKGEVVLPGEIGEIIVRGDNLMKGYWKEPEQTGQLLKDGWFYSGDLAVLDEAGYIYIKDRKKEVIISGGENIYPREVEEVIYLNPKVKEVAVIGVSDSQWGEAVKAIVVLREDSKATSDEIIEWCKKDLASYKKPRFVEFVEELPLISLGKIAKQELKKRYG